MKSKEYTDLQEAIGYLIDRVHEIDELIDSLDESKEDYMEIKKKIDGLCYDVEDVKRDLEYSD